MTKKFTPLFLAFALVSLCANAQDLKNTGFEDWTAAPFTTYDTADHWTASYVYGAEQGVNESSDAYEGSSSLQLSNNGFGSSDSIWQAIPNASFDEDALVGYYKSDILANDSGVVRVTYKKGEDEILSTSEMYITATTSEWTYFQVKLDKRAADSIVVYFESSVTGEGSKLWIDALGWDNFVSADTKSDLKLAAFPNPANDFVTLSFDHMVTNANIRLISITGKTVMNRALNQLNNSKVQLNVSAIQAGVYLIEVNENGMNYTQRLIIK